MQQKERQLSKLLHNVTEELVAEVGREIAIVLKKESDRLSSPLWLTMLNKKIERKKFTEPIRPHPPDQKL